MKSCIFFAALLVCLSSNSQVASPISLYSNKIFIFNFDVPVYKVTSEFAISTKDTNPSPAWQGAGFKVRRILDADVASTPFKKGDLIIQFISLKKKKDKKSTSKQAQVTDYNKKIEAYNNSYTNDVFYLLKFTDFQSYTSAYVAPPQDWEISFGTIGALFKFRFNPSYFNTNVNLGASINFQKKLKNPNFSMGVIGGLSLTSITLDSFSTKGVVMTNTDRPAITPSLHFMVAYKFINVTLGIGWDYINRISSVERSWIYQGNRWLGVGIGINLFTNSTSSTPTGTPSAPAAVVGSNP